MSRSELPYLVQLVVLLPRNGCSLEPQCTGGIDLGYGRNFNGYFFRDFF